MELSLQVARDLWILKYGEMFKHEVIERMSPTDVQWNDIRNLLMRERQFEWVQRYESIRLVKEGERA